jgi:methylphosphotriester-DNA--protein-cysteine methyltransferase
VYFAELICGPNDPEWGEENQVSRPIVAFPATPVWQVHDGAAPTLMNANHAVFHHPGSEYRRERFQGQGYRCVFFFPSPSLVREMAAEVDPSATDAETYRFPHTTARLDGRVFARCRRLATDLAAGGLQGLGAREGLYTFLRSAVHSAYRGYAPRRVRPQTSRAHVEIVEETKELITRGLAEPIRLDELAGDVHVSPYHLSRIFRAITGYPIHAYQTHLRLRVGLDRLERGWARDIGQLGVDLGFSSHSHFSSAFRSTLGVRPSDVQRHGSIAEPA